MALGTTYDPLRYMSPVGQNVAAIGQQAAQSFANILQNNAAWNKMQKQSKNDKEFKRNLLNITSDFLIDNGIKAGEIALPSADDERYSPVQFAEMIEKQLTPIKEKLNLKAGLESFGLEPETPADPSAAPTRTQDILMPQAQSPTERLEAGLGREAQGLPYGQAPQQAAPSPMERLEGGLSREAAGLPYSAPAAPATAAPIPALPEPSTMKPKTVFEHKREYVDQMRENLVNSLNEDQRKLDALANAGRITAESYVSQSQDIRKQRHEILKEEYKNAAEERKSLEDKWATGVLTTSRMIVDPATGEELALTPENINKVGMGSPYPKEFAPGKKTGKGSGNKNASENLMKNYNTLFDNAAKIADAEMADDPRFKEVVDASNENAVKALAAINIQVAAGGEDKMDDVEAQQEAVATYNIWRALKDNLSKVEPFETPAGEPLVPRYGTSMTEAFLSGYGNKMRQTLTPEEYGRLVDVLRKGEAQGLTPHKVMNKYGDLIYGRSRSR